MLSQNSKNSVLTHVFFKTPSIRCDDVVLHALSPCLSWPLHLLEPNHLTVILFFLPSCSFSLSRLPYYDSSCPPVVFQSCNVTRPFPSWPSPNYITSLTLALCLIFPFVLGTHSLNLTLFFPLLYALLLFPRLLLRERFF